LDDDCYNHGHTFTNVHVSEFRDSAFVVEGRMAMSISFYDCHCDGSHDDGDSPAGGLTCVRTGRVDPNPDPHDGSAEDALLSQPAGNFYWYGGTATDLSNAVFQLGGISNTILISGIHTKRSRALLDSRFSGSVITPFPVMIESADFETDGIGLWAGRFQAPGDPDCDDYPPTNDYGRVITFPYRGPLVVRSSVIGRCEGTDSSAIDNPSFGWTYVEGAGLDNVLGKAMYLGGFLFEGNAIATTASNPFVPEDVTDGVEPEFFVSHQNTTADPWRYPTSQRSNLSCQGGDGSGMYWGPMPQHFTEVELGIGDMTLTVAEVPTSHELFVLSGAGIVNRIEHGVPGMVVVLTVSGDNPAAMVYHDLSASSGGIQLFNQSPFMMHDQDTLWLVQDPDGVWQELGRSDN